MSTAGTGRRRSEGRKGGNEAPGRGTTAKRGPGMARAGGSASSDVGRAVVRAALPALRKQRGEGLGVVVAVAEGIGSQWDLAWAITDRTGSGGGRLAARAGGGGGGGRRPASRSQAARLAGALAALGSVHRVQILAKLLEGPGTYRTLQKVTRLKAGPLYHHVAQLRLAGLIGPKQRDLYELTRGGRNLVLVALTLPKLIRDRRPRPQPGAGEVEVRPKRRR